MNLAEELVALMRASGMKCATAESCTGGGIGHALTAVSGSSAVYLGGVISYANSVKEQVLGVPRDVLATVGAVSEETARAMAEGVCRLLGADIGIAVTGIAGPNSDGTDKPVGLVYIAVTRKGRTVVTENHFSGDRENVRCQTIETALRMALEA